MTIDELVKPYKRTTFLAQAIVLPVNSEETIVVKRTSVLTSSSCINFTICYFNSRYFALYKHQICCRTASRVLRILNRLWIHGELALTATIEPVSQDSYGLTLQASESPPDFWCQHQRGENYPHNSPSQGIGQGQGYILPQACQHRAGF